MMSEEEGRFKPSGINREMLCHPDAVQQGYLKRFVDLDLHPFKARLEYRGNKVKYL